MKIIKTTITTIMQVMAKRVVRSLAWCSFLFVLLTGASSALAQFTVNVPSTSANGSYSLTVSATVSSGYSCSTAQYAFAIPDSVLEFKDGQQIASWPYNQAPGSFSGKSPGVYTYHLTAHDQQIDPFGGPPQIINCGVVVSDSVTVLGPPATPASITVPTTTEYDGVFNVSWSSVNYATSYELLERSNTGGGWSGWTSIHNAAGTSKSRSGLGVASWQYAVKACNAQGCSGWKHSSAVTMAALGTPNQPSAPSISYTSSYTLSWNAVSGAQFYQVLERVDGGEWAWPHNNSSAVSLFRSGRSLGTWEYQVRGCNGSVCGGWSPLKTVVVSTPAIPAAPTGPSSSNGSFTVSWSSVAGSSSYKLEQSLYNGSNWTSWTEVYSGSNTSSTIAGSIPGQWRFRLRACSLTGCSAYSGDYSLSVYPPSTSHTIIAPSQNYTGSYQVDWGHNTGCLGDDSLQTCYTALEYKDGVLQPLFAVAGDVTDMTGKTNGNYYYELREYFKVYAPLGYGYAWITTPEQVIAGSSVIVILPPENKNLSVSTLSNDQLGNFHLSWDSDLDADTYKLEQQTNGGGFVEIQNSSSTSIPITGKPEVTTLQYRVRSCNVAGCSDPSFPPYTVVVDYPTPSTAPLLSGDSSSTDGDIEISWSGNIVGEVTHFNVEKNINGQITLANGSSPYTLSGLPNGKVLVRVRACNLDDDCGPWSNQIESMVSQATTLSSAPSETGGTASDNYTGLSDSFNGSLSGSLGVSPSGAATYSIPLQLPQGTGGMTPSVALVYNSNAGEGVLGMGWSLAGVGGAVSRCQQTIAQDGALGEISLTNSDKFCLNGSRLVPIGSGSDSRGAYTEYRTELESFQRVRAYGTFGTGPAEFTVWERDGTQLHFGGNDASVENSGPNGLERLRWLLYTIEDVHGNQVKLEYEESSAPYDIRLKEVLYGGNTTTGQSHYAKVKMTYEGLSNIIPRYQFGKENSATKRMSSISMHLIASGESIWSDVREYVFEFDNGATSELESGVSRLTSVSLCAPNGTCANPVNFDWVAETVGFSTSIWNGPSKGNTVNHWVDMNGDGLTDFVTKLANSSDFNVSLSSGNQFQAVQIWNGVVRGSSAVETFADMNGDAKLDYVTVESGGIHKVVLSNGAGFEDYATWNAGDFSYPEFATNQHYFLDINGDGRTDYVVLDTQIKVNLSTGSGYSAVQNWGGPDLASTLDDTLNRFDFQDMNKDGLIDIVVIETSGDDKHTIYYNNGNGFEAGIDYLMLSGSHSVGGVWKDMNADGYLDYVGTSAGYNHSIRFWTGDGYEYVLWPILPGGGDSGGAFHDMNGDGLVDYVLAEMGETSGNYTVMYSTGQGYSHIDVINGPYRADATEYYYFMDANADGRTDIAVMNHLDYPLLNLRVGINQSQPVQLMNSITDGLGNTTTISYAPTSDSSVHQQLSDAQYPKIDMSNASYIVSSVSQPDGIGGANMTSYKYEGFKFEHGRGSLGFKKVFMENEDQKTRAVTEYYQDYPLIGQVKATEVYITDVNDDGVIGDEQKLSSSVISYASYNGVANLSGPSIKYVCLDTQTSLQYDLDGTLLSTTVVDNDPNGSGACDAYGYNELSSVSITDHTENNTSHISTTTQVMTHNATNWLLGQLTNVIVEQSLDGVPVANGVADNQGDREVEYHYNTDGLLDWSIREPNQAAPIKLTTTYGYDVFGNLNSETVSPSESPSVQRTESIFYDARGRFPQSLTNAAGHTSTLGYNEQLGVVERVEGPNYPEVDATLRTFDAFGRQLTETRPDGVVESISYRLVGNNATGISDRSQAMVMVESIVNGGSDQFSPVRTYLDGFGRTIRTRTRAFDASNFLHQDVLYDSRGRVAQSSESYFEGDVPRWNVPSYDVLGRNTGIVASDPTQNASITYNDFNVTTHDAVGRSRTVVSNAVGQTSRVYENDEGNGGLAVMDFQYNAAGQLEKTVKLTPMASEISKTMATYTYDRLGRRLSSDDPDLGLITYEYNSFNEPIKQQTPRLRAYSSALYLEMEYDVLGRLIERTDPTDDLNGVITTTYDYDETSNNNAGIGQLTTESLMGGSQPAYTRSYFYDGSEGGQVTDVTTTVDSDSFTVSNSYDALGRLESVTYPQTPSYPTGYTVDYAYNPRGYLERVSDPQSNEIMYQVMQVNALGQIEQAWMGDDSVTTRTYIDGTNRLISTNAARQNGGTENIQNQIYQYDALGNMTMRSDLLRDLKETFTYDELSRLTSATVSDGSAVVTDFEYDEIGNLTHKSDITSLLLGSMEYGNTGNAGAHAITSQDDGVNIHSFTYDENGNLLTGDVSGNGRSISWTSFDKPSTITQGAITRNFAYGPGRSRYQQVHNDGGGAVTTTYIGDMYTRTNHGGGEIEHKLYVFAGSEVIAIEVDQDDAGSVSTDTRYLHKDHLGSITAIVDSAGIEALSYDAYGQRRSASDWLTPGVNASEERGYTGHEHLDDVNIIHMNGRVYDPVMARFVSADPILQAPFNSQNYNRYSYVLNNPLRYTDPSGYQFDLNTGLPIFTPPTPTSTYHRSEYVSMPTNFESTLEWNSSYRQTIFKSPVLNINIDRNMDYSFECPVCNVVTSFFKQVASLLGSEGSDRPDWARRMNTVQEMNVMNLQMSLHAMDSAAGVAAAASAYHQSYMIAFSAWCIGTVGCSQQYGVEVQTAGANSGSLGQVGTNSITAAVGSGNRAGVFGQEGRNNAMMSALAPFVESGDFIGFWKEAQKYDEPLAELALSFHDGLYGQGLSKIAISKLELAFTGGTRLPPSELLALKNSVGRGVMEFHYNALKVDIRDNLGSIPGVLSQGQVDEYHYNYFESIGLPKDAYGGHIPGFLKWTYCGGCDPSGP